MAKKIFKTIVNFIAKPGETKLIDKRLAAINNDCKSYEIAKRLSRY